MKMLIPDKLVHFLYIEIITQALQNKALVKIQLQELEIKLFFR
jgi:hypothetical protein